MFFFENYTWETILMGFAILAALIIVNEVTRRYKYAGIAVYIILPIALTIFLWPKSAGPGTDAGYWFAWVKTYSVLAGVIGFMAIRYFKKLQSNKWVLAFPAAILAINIAEAVFRDFECYFKDGTIENGLKIVGGSWNIMNGIAGIFTIITLTGILGIKVANTKSKDMIWPDQLWFWIIGYDLWNMAYVYNCIPDRSFYAGFILLMSCTLAAFFIKKGAWLQHRANTLALWAMFSLSYSYGRNSNLFGITSAASSDNTAPLLVLSIASIVFNTGVLAYEIYRLIKAKKNPVTNDIYFDLKTYKKIMESNKLS